MLQTFVRSEPAALFDGFTTAEPEWAHACHALLMLGYDPAKGIVALAAAMEARAKDIRAQAQRKVERLRDRYYDAQLSPRYNSCWARRLEDDLQDAEEEQEYRNWASNVLCEVAASLRSGEVRPISESEAEYTDLDLHELAASDNLDVATAAIMLYPRNAVWSSDDIERVLERWRRRG